MAGAAGGRQQVKRWRGWPKGRQQVERDGGRGRGFGSLLGAIDDRIVTTRIGGIDFALHFINRSLIFFKSHEKNKSNNI